MRILLATIVILCLAASPLAQGYTIVGGLHATNEHAIKAAKKLMPHEVKRAIQYALKNFATDPLAIHRTLRDKDLTATARINNDRENVLLILADAKMDENTTIDIYRELVQDNADFNTVDAHGRGILHLLADRGQAEVINFILSKNARADLKTRQGDLPSDYAKKAGHHDIAATLEMYEQAHAMANDPNYTVPTEVETNTTTMPTQTEAAKPVAEQDLPDFMVNLNQRALAGEIDALIGRVEEVKRILKVLGQRRSNNPVLVGMPGVGKTAIVEGLAHLITKGEVPSRFRDKTIYAVNISGVNAGTGVRGALEEKVKQLLLFAEQHPHAIFFIDELHHLISGDTGGGINIAEQLKPALAAGKLPVIGATTDDEFRQIERDGALERRFVRINIDEPTEAEIIDIVFGVRDLIAIHQDIDIADEAVLAVVEFAKLFKDKQRPASAVALLDEAASALAISDDFHQLNLNSITTKISSLTNALSSAQLGDKDKIAEEIEQLKATYAQDLLAWQQQVDKKQALQTTEANIEATEKQINQLEHAEKFAEADELRKNALQQLFTQRQELIAHKVLERRHVAELVAAKLKVPVAKLMLEEQEGVSDVLPQLQQHIFGQDKQLEEITGLVAMTEQGLNRNLPPSFLLLGPSGVGKTVTVEKLGAILDNGKRKIIRINMNQYKEEHRVSALLGAPAGYVGYEDGSHFINEIKANPSAIILLDEIEKAHPDLHSLLLNMLEGHLTSGDNQEIDLTQTMIFMTSNSRNPDEDFFAAVRGRISREIIYNALSPEIMSRLVQVEIAKLNESLQSKGIVVELSDEMITALANEGHDEELGARPLQNLFQRNITEMMSLRLMQGELQTGKYRIELEDDNIKVNQDE